MLTQPQQYTRAGRVQRLRSLMTELESAINTAMGDRYLFVTLRYARTELAQLERQERTLQTLGMRRRIEQLEACIRSEDPRATAKAMGITIEGVRKCS